MDANQVIADIRRGYGLDLDIHDILARTAVDNLRKTVERACTNLSAELYSRVTHFILELVQNADDNTYAPGVVPTLKIELQDDYINVTTNEVGFSEANVRAICKIGGSTKFDKTQGFIGEKGIGFKAVFTIANVVEIRSGMYAFKFDKSGPLGMLAPILLDSNSSRVQEGTHIRLLLSSPAEQSPMLVSHLLDIKPTMLLFLKKLQRLDITCRKNTSVSVTKTDIQDGLTRIVQGTDHYYYRIHSHWVDMPEDDKRKGLLQSNIVLAFPVSDGGDPIIEDQNVHAFLALRSYGLPFIVQGDFLTSASREDILVDRRWNKALRDAIPIEFVNTVLEMLKHSRLKYSWIQYIPSSVHDSFFQPVSTGITELLRRRRVLFNEAGQMCLPSNLVMLPPQFRDAEGAALLPSTNYLSTGYNAISNYVNIMGDLGVQTMSEQSFLTGLKAMGQKISMQPASWQENVYSVLHGMVWSYRISIRGLPIVPLVDGQWTCVTDDIVFDADLADHNIPRDIQFRLVKNLDSSSSHYRLLSALGTKKADLSAVIRRIRELHSESASLRNHASSLPAHAWFLFKHRSMSETRQFPLKVVTTSNSILPAANVYMDHPDITPPLSNALERSNAPFLRRDYDKFCGTADESLEWKDWLRQKGLNITPKMDNMQLSGEFRVFLTSASTTHILFLLASMAGAISSLVASSGALRELKAIRVITSDRSSHALEDTYIPRRMLTHAGSDLPFLPVNDPESPNWEFLRKLGVTFELNARHYLKQLILLSQKQAVEGQTDVKVLTLYKQLEARFDEGHSDAIRSAFKERPLIYVPALLQASGRWISFAEAVWVGPRSMQSKTALISVYPSLQIFFCKRIGLEECPHDICLQELQNVCLRVGDTRLDEAMHCRIHAILHDLSLVLRAFSSSPSPTAHDIGWFKELRDMKFVPVALHTTDGQIKEARLRKLQEDFYIPEDPHGFLASLFYDEVHMVTQPPQGSTGTWRGLLRLLRSEWCSGVKFLENSVKQSLEEDSSIDNRTPNLALSTHYRERLPLLIRTVRSSKDRELARSAIAKLRDIGVYDTASGSVIHSYSLGEIVRKQTSSLGVKISNNRCIILIGSDCRESGLRDVQVGRELARLFPVFAKDTIAQILIHRIEVIEALYSASRALDDDAEDSMSAGWLTSSLQNSVKKVQRVSIGPQWTTNTSISPIVTVENEFQNLLSRDLLRLRRVAERQALSDAKCNPESLTYDLKRMVLGSVRILDGGDPGNTIVSKCTTGYSIDSHAPGTPIGVAPRAMYPPSSHIPMSMQEPSGFIGASVTSRQRPTGEQEYTGIIGEIYVFLWFESNLPYFTCANWTSALRTHMGFKPFLEESKAAFTYPDKEGVLTQMLLGMELTEKWLDNWPTYYLEVKSSSYAANTPFHVSASQLRYASEMSLHDGKEVPQAIYVLVRVSSVRNEPEVVLYPDPWRCLFGGNLRIVSDVEMTITSG